jgi:hypothetical protein
MILDLAAHQRLRSLLRAPLDRWWQERVGENFLDRQSGCQAPVPGPLSVFRQSLLPRKDGFRGWVRAGVSHPVAVNSLAILEGRHVFGNLQT